MTTKRYHMENHNLDGKGLRSVRVYDMAVDTFHYGQYWPQVTDRYCPAGNCHGTVWWAEAGYVPGYRMCDTCGAHFMAAGDAANPALIRVPGRKRGSVWLEQIRRA
jgi:hypothetical protein